MKKLVTVQEVEGEGLEAFLGEPILIMCGGYFYSGKLVGVNNSCVCLEDASIVYETGPFNDKGYKDAQRLHPKFWYVQLAAIESFGAAKC